MSEYGDLIGIPFKYGGRGMDYFDCYGLVLYLLKRNLGVEVPDFVSPDRPDLIVAKFHQEMSKWSACELKPDAVLVFRVPGNLHVGYYLGYDKFIHAWEGSGGVVIEQLSLWKRRLLGIYEYRT